MKKSNREKRKAGIGNVTEIAICDTPEERTLRSRQVQRTSVLVSLPVLHALQCIERIQA